MRTIPRLAMFRFAAALAAAAIVAPAVLSGCAAAPAPTCGPSAGSCLRILFVGNSFTFANDLPGTFARLALAGGHEVTAGQLASGGQTLAGHLGDPATAARLDAERWDYVVLQEQSEIPASDASRDYTMYPSARALAAEIRHTGGTPLFFMTWAYRDGDAAVGRPDYETMQRAIDDAYLGIARELEAPVAPVGYVWFLVHRQHPEMGLWQDDGSHPSVAGTYLAACIFYATVFRRSPEGSVFLDGLPADTAALIQKAAASYVLDDPAQWNLP
jgi:hypothetical protein